MIEDGVQREEEFGTLEGGGSDEAPLNCVDTAEARIHATGRSAGPTPCLPPEEPGTTTEPSESEDPVEPSGQ